MNEADRLRWARIVDVHRAHVEDMTARHPLNPADLTRRGGQPRSAYAVQVTNRANARDIDTIAAALERIREREPGGPLRCANPGRSGADRRVYCRRNQGHAGECEALNVIGDPVRWRDSEAAAHGLTSDP